MPVWDYGKLQSQGNRWPCPGFKCKLAYTEGATMAKCGMQSSRPGHLHPHFPFQCCLALRSFFLNSDNGLVLPPLLHFSPFPVTDSCCDSLSSTSYFFHFQLGFCWSPCSCSLDTTTRPFVSSCYARVRQHLDTKGNNKSSSATRTLHRSLFVLRSS